MSKVNRLLRDVLPEFTNELRELLASEPDILATVNSLELVDRCRCGDGFCASFYTLPAPRGAWGEGHENVVLEPEVGMVILDVIDRRIGMVEVIDRPDVKEVIDRLDL